MGRAEGRQAARAADRAAEGPRRNGCASPRTRRRGRARRRLDTPSGIGSKRCRSRLRWQLPERRSELRFPPVDQGMGDEDAQQSLRRQSELGRLLSAATGYRVVAGDGTFVGWLDHVRYEQYADRPDELVVVRRRGLLLKQGRAFPFSRVEAVRPRERTVVLRLERVTLERSPSA
jgi:hypothetical protein